VVGPVDVVVDGAVDVVVSGELTVARLPGAVVVTGGAGATVVGGATVVAVVLVVVVDVGTAVEVVDAGGVSADAGRVPPNVRAETASRTAAPALAAVKGRGVIGVNGGMTQERRVPLKPARTAPPLKVPGQRVQGPFTGAL